MRIVSELKTKLADVKKNSSKDVAALQSKLAKVPSTVHREQHSGYYCMIYIYIYIENCSPNCNRHLKHTVDREIFAIKIFFASCFGGAN